MPPPQQNQLTTSLLGFTLAEVLITLGIIGVVAALTMPSLIQKHQEQTMVVKVKKGHNQLENALNMYLVQNSCDNLLCLFDNKNKTNIEVAQEFSKMFQGAEVCTNNSSKKCKVYALKGNTPSYKVDGKYASGDNFGSSGRILLPNGISYRIFLQNGECIQPKTSPVRDENGYDTGETVTYNINYCGLIYMDINGYQGPNQFGADVYRYDIKADGTFKSADQKSLNNALLDNKIRYTKYNIGDDVK